MPEVPINPSTKFLRSTDGRWSPIMNWAIRSFHDGVVGLIV